MGSEYVTNPLGFLLSTLFSLYILILMLRFLLGLVRADFYNPMSQFLVKLTNPPLIPLRQMIPAFGRVDMAAVILLIALKMLELTLLAWLQEGKIPAGGLFLWTLAELLSLGLNIFLFSILIQAILSWVNPGTFNPLSSLLASLNEPILAPIRRFLPPLGGIDLSPVLAIIGLQVVKMLVIPPLLHFV